MLIAYYKMVLPTTSNSADTDSVWNDGASADTSQLNFPDMFGSTAFNRTWLAFDCELYKYELKSINKTI